jgi:hypothetical protein
MIARRRKPALQMEQFARIQQAGHGFHRVAFGGHGIKGIGSTNRQNIAIMAAGTSC